MDWVKACYLNRALRYQDQFDGYIYLTEAMSAAVAPGKPYMIMEGILNADTQGDTVAKAPKRAVMYAGRLHEKYGVLALADAFERLNLPETELWLFGDGSAAADIQERAKRNSQICYLGRVSREEILKKEKEATLLVNPRSVKDPFTRYSFPSKTIEYMHSGTPLLTTRLEGIPEEYFDYVFVAQDNTEPELDNALRQALSMTDDELAQMGEKARQFIITQKNPAVQCRRILEFLHRQLGDCYEEGRDSDF